MLDIFRPAKSIRRLSEVQRVITRYGFDFIFETREVKQVRALFEKPFIGPTKTIMQMSAAERLRMMLQELGPTYVKLGQIVSSRRDIIPEEYAQELSKLQDQVPPFPFDTVQKIIHEEFGKPYYELFKRFDPEPFAAASIGQVHQAWLQDDTPVVVKVQRPSINDQVHSDLEIIRIIARMINNTNIGKRYGVLELFEEFAKTLVLEMDYKNEAVNADRLRRIMESEPKVCVPEVYWDYISERVLTMEWINGIKINNLEKLQELQVNKPELASTFVRSIFSQLLLHGFYHADPHPANLFVKTDTHQLVYLDLGMTGRLLPNQRQRIQDLILSILRRDSQDVTRLLISIGIPFKKVDEYQLTRSIDFIINRYMEVSLEQIDFSATLSEILLTIFRYNLRLPSEFGLAIKTLVQGEEVARLLDPKITVIDVAEDMAKQILNENFKPERIIDFGRDTIRELFRMRDVFPRAFESILRQLESGKFTVAIDIPMFKWIINSIMIIANRLVAGLVITGILIASTMMITNSAGEWGLVIRILGFLGFTGALLLGGILVIHVIREISRFERNKKEDL